MRSSTTTTVPATVTGHPPSTSFVALQLLSTSLLRILPLTQIPIPPLKTHTISHLLLWRPSPEPDLSQISLVVRVVLKAFRLPQLSGEFLLGRDWVGWEVCHHPVRRV